MDIFFFFQAEDGIRYLVRSRGLGDVYKRQSVEGTGRPMAPLYSFRSSGLMVAAGEVSVRP